MSDLLASASLLLAIVTVMYGLWYPEIIAALNENIPAHDGAKFGPYKEILNIIKYRAIPLAGASCLVALVFLPEAFKITWHSLLSYMHDFLGTLLSYNAITTSFVLVDVIAILLAVHLTLLTFRLFDHKNKLAPSDEFLAVLRKNNQDPAGN